MSQPWTANSKSRTSTIVRIGTIALVPVYRLGREVLMGGLTPNRTDGRQDRAVCADPIAVDTPLAALLRRARGLPRRQG